MVEHAHINHGTEERERLPPGLTGSDSHIKATRKERLPGPPRVANIAYRALLLAVRP